MPFLQSHVPKRPHYRYPTTCVDPPHCGHGHRVRRRDVHHVHARYVLFHPHDHRDPHDLCGHRDVRRHHGARRRDHVHRGLRVRGRHDLHHGYGLYDHRDARRHDGHHFVVVEQLDHCHPRR